MDDNERFAARRCSTSVSTENDFSGAYGLRMPFRELTETEEAALPFDAGEAAAILGSKETGWQEEVE